MQIIITIIGSLYLNNVSIIQNRILQLHQAGIIDEMDRLFYPIPPQCDGKPKNKKDKSKEKRLSRLSLKNLTGAFVVLFFGMSLSLLTFSCEKIFAKFSKRRRVQTIEIQPEPKNIAVEESSEEESPAVIEE